MRTPLEQKATHILVLRSSNGERSSSPLVSNLLRSESFFFQTPSYKEQERSLQQLIAAGMALEVKPEVQHFDIFEKEQEKIMQGIDEGKQSFDCFWNRNFH